MLSRACQKWCTMANQWRRTSFCSKQFLWIQCLQCTHSNSMSKALWWSKAHWAAFSMHRLHMQRGIAIIPSLKRLSLFSATFSKARVTGAALCTCGTISLVFKSVLLEKLKKRWQRLTRNSQLFTLKSATPPRQLNTSQKPKNSWPNLSKMPQTRVPQPINSKSWEKSKHMSFSSNTLSLIRLKISKSRFISSANRQSVRLRFSVRKVPKFAAICS